MDQGQARTDAVTLRVENIGGITETAVGLSPGVTVLSGRNATNRTSLLQALMAVLGSDHASIKGDADEGRVELDVGETTYTRRLRSRDDTVVTDGDPYLEDATLADLFAFLLEGNDARRAVARGDDLREIIMRPVDTDQFEARIDQLEDERREIDDELEEISSLERRLPEREEKRADLEARIDEKCEELAARKEEIDAIDAEARAGRGEDGELESRLEELNEYRGKIETIRNEIDAGRESIEALREERAGLEADIEDHPDVPDDRIGEIDGEVQRLRRRLTEIENDLDEIQTVIQFNEGFLDGSLDPFSSVRGDGGTDGSVTDQLLENGEELVCWTCGSEVDTGQIETMLDRLRDLRRQKTNQRNDFRERIDELEDERSQLEERRDHHDRIRTRLDRIGEEIDEHRAHVETSRERRSELEDRIDELESEVERLRTNDHGELLNLHTETTRLEVEIERLEDDLGDVEAEIERLEERAGERGSLETRREEIQAEIEELRTRVEHLERGAIEAFNDHMEAVLDILEYDNLERIWIERVEREVREGRRTVTKGQFDLHVVRSTPSGAVYEDTVEHLSESEREVTGLVFALAGYLTHDLHEEVPFMLLDSVEAVDADRLADLVDYFGEFADYLVIALLSEDADALDDRYPRITDI